MPTYTEKLHLEKPNENEYYDVGVFNANYDKIDYAIDEASKQGGIAVGDTPPEKGDLWLDTSLSSEGGTFNDLYTAQVNELPIDTLNTTNKTVSGAINELNGKVKIKALWGNPYPSNDFSAQEITFNEDISNFDFYFIRYTLHKTYNTRLSTGLIPITDTTCLTGSKNVFTNRDTSVPSGTSMRFADCTLWTAYNGNSSNTANAYCVPITVYGVTLG